ncbi:hypothetical protein ACFRAM_28625 [Paenibacillus sp. NPDC056722]|uniref:hypothetical protein n=1 Tax=Paenibacillus sp. NPDC056722 TaxID=3345924 RepID=UPI0036C1738F
MSTDHRAEAVGSLKYWANAEDSQTAISYASEATAHALLYAGDQLAALVEQQKVQLLVSAYVTGVPMTADERAVAQARIKAALGLAEGGAE